MDNLIFILVFLLGLFIIGFFYNKWTIEKSKSLIKKIKANIK